MSLFPDPTDLLSVADRIADHARAARARARDLGTAIAVADWHGAAAEAFERTAQAVLSGLHQAGHRLDDAADALRRHSAVVRAVLDEIERIGGDAVGIGGDLVGAAGDALLHPRSLFGDASGLLADSAGLVVDVGDVLGLD